MNTDTIKSKGNNNLQEEIIDYSEMPEFDAMSQKDKINFIFKLHNAEFIQDKLKGYINECTFTHTPSFEKHFEFKNQDNEVLKLSMMGEILESPANLEDLSELYPINIARDELLTFSELVGSKLKRTFEMVDKVF